MCFRVTAISEAPQVLLASPFYVQSMGAACPAILGHHQPVPPHLLPRDRLWAPPTSPSRGTSNLCLPTCPLQGPQHTLRGRAGRPEHGAAVSRECSSQTRCLHISKLHRLILVNKLVTGHRPTVIIVMMFSVVHTTSPQTKAAQTLGCPVTVV